LLFLLYSMVYYFYWLLCFAIVTVKNDLLWLLYITVCYSYCIVWFVIVTLQYGLLLLLYNMVHSLLIYSVIFNTNSSNLGSTRFWILIVYNMCYWFILVVLHIEVCLECSMWLCVMCVILFYSIVLYCTVLYRTVMYCIAFSSLAI